VNIPRREPEGLPRLMMVLAGMAPLFILWAIRGITPIPSVYLIPSCLSFAILPNLYLWVRIHTTRKNNLQGVICIGNAEDHRNHLLAYLFALLLPLYDANIEDTRGFTAIMLAFFFICFLFWHLNLHYMNIFLAFCGYRVYTIQPPKNTPDTPIGGQEPFVLITWRPYINDMHQISAFYVSRTLYFEPKPKF